MTHTASLPRLHPRGIFFPGASRSLLAQSLAITESGRAPSQPVGQQSEIRMVMDFPPLEVWVRDFN